MTAYATDLDASAPPRRGSPGLPIARRLLTCATLDRIAGRSLFFKCEHLQKVGAFKFRGACNAVMKLTDDQAARGVVTHSSGNHAQALALAARLRGIPAHIVMPSNATPAKRRAVEEYGGQVTECEPLLTARESIVAEVDGPDRRHADSALRSSPTSSPGRARPRWSCWNRCRSSMRWWPRSAAAGWFRASASPAKGIDPALARLCRGTGRRRRRRPIQGGRRC